MAVLMGICARVVGLLVSFGLVMADGPVHAARLKDLADVSGARSNQLVGYGIVVGLAGTGDDGSANLGALSLSNLLRNLGNRISTRDMRLRNIAAVLVTAELPAFLSSGQRVDVTVSSIGNATSLLGGTLVATPLKGSDLQIYAVAQGPISVGGVAIGGQSGTALRRNHVNVGRIPGGALVERAVTRTGTMTTVTINLRDPDFTTAQRVVDALEQYMTTIPAEAERQEVDASPDGETSQDTEPREDGQEANSENASEDEAKKNDAQEGENAPILTGPKAMNAGRIEVPIPASMKDNMVAFVAGIEVLEVEPSVVSRVVLNERTGTVVLGEGVWISPVAIAHGDLTLEVSETPVVSQPSPFSRGGQTAVVPRTQVLASESESQLQEVRPGASLGEVVKALNALGVSPRDLVAVLQGIKAAGALRAELVIQ